MAKARQKQKHPELADDAWQRFERAVDIVAKSPPQHRKSKTTRKRKKTTKKRA
jgi:hypothetical protein